MIWLLSVGMQVNILSLKFGSSKLGKPMALSNFNKGQIVKKSQPVQNISSTADSLYAVVSTYPKRSKEGQLMNWCQAHGHPRLIDFPTHRKVTIACNTKKVNAGSDRKVSEHIVHHSLLCMRLCSHRPVSVIMLTYALQRKQLQCAGEHQNWTIEQWEKVVQSDESHFLDVPWKEGKLGNLRSCHSLGCYLLWQVQYCITYLRTVADLEHTIHGKQYVQGCQTQCKNGSGMVSGTRVQGVGSASKFWISEMCRTNKFDPWRPHLTTFWDYRMCCYSNILVLDTADSSELFWQQKWDLHNTRQVVIVFGWLRYVWFVLGHQVCLKKLRTPLLRHYSAL